MRKGLKAILSLALATVLMLSLLACGGEKAGEAQTGEEAAETAEEAPACAGFWKYDDYPFYIVISASLEWAAYDETGTQTFHGHIEEDGDSYLMYYDGMDDPEVLSLSGDKLVDQDGGTLSRTGEFDFAASMNDKLTQVAYFPGKFEAFSINYPANFNAEARTDLANTLSFGNKTPQPGSSDYYSNIMVTFQPLADVDKYMGKGAGLAKPCMGYLINNFMKSIYGNYIIKSIGSDFKDMGNHYKITEFIWMDGSIYPDSGLEQVLAVAQMRYFGPTGYAMFGITIAPEDVIENYYGICLNMLDTCTYRTDWSTAPKEVPKQAGSNKGKTKKSTSKKNNTAVETFYWTDEDGDIWYWNGYENIFQSFGNDGYIDDDGEFYESNDAGWDTGDYVDDYDLFSDPGDGYDEWSDPGDYSDAGDYGGYDDYSYDDSDW